MNKLLESFNGGTVEQQKRRKLGLLVIAATLALLILATLVLIVGAIVSLVTGDGPDTDGEKDQDDTVYIKTVITDSASEGNLLQLDDAHPYLGEAKVVKFVNHSSRPKNAKGQNIYSLRDSTNFSGTEETVVALHKLIKAYYDQSEDDDNLIVDQAYATNLSQQIDTIFSMGTTVSLTYYANYAEDKDPTNEPSINGVERYKWIYQHAHEYGFIHVEDNIFRYVGQPHASYMKANGLTLAQYLDKLSGTSYKKTLKTTVAGETYRIYYASASEDIKVPEDLDWSYSGNNMGGYIITFKVK